MDKKNGVNLIKNCLNNFHKKMLVPEFVIRTLKAASSQYFLNKETFDHEVGIAY
jgi:hypothetical protein